MIGLLRPYPGADDADVHRPADRDVAGPPALLAGQVIDAGIQTGDLGVARLSVAVFLGAVVVGAVGTAAAELPGRLGGQACCRPARAALRPRPVDVDRLLHPSAAPASSSRGITNDIEAINQLVTDGVVTMFSNTLTLVGVVVICSCST